MRVTISRDLAPILGLGAAGITRGAGFFRQHETLRRGLEIGGAAFLTALVGRRFIGGLGGLRGLRGIGGLLGSRGFVAAKAAEDVMTGSTIRGYTPANPLYVIVVGQIFGGGGGGVRGREPPIPFGGRGPREPFRPPPYMYFGATTAALAAASAATLLMTPGATRLEDRSGLDILRRGSPAGRRKFLPNIMAQFEHPDSPGRRNFPGFFKKVMAADSLQELQQLDRQLAQILHNQTRRDQSMAVVAGSMLGGFSKKATFNAEGELVLNIKVTDPTGRTTEKRVHLPASYTGGKVPTARGHRKSIRADFPIRTQGGK
jgi:hypothetical protein